MKKTCTEFMTRDPITCTPDDTAQRVASLMKTADIGPVPVVEGKDAEKLIGIVTDRDLALRVVGEGRDPRSTTVSEVMTPDPVTCHNSDDVQKALDKMSENCLRRIPIIDDDGRLVGVIAQADVATKLAEPDKVANVVKEISKPNRES